MLRVFLGRRTTTPTRPWLVAFIIGSTVFGLVLGTRISPSCVMVNVTLQIAALPFLIGIQNSNHRNNNWPPPRPFKQKLLQSADDGAVGERLYTYTSNLHLALDLSSRRASVKDASRGGAFDIMVVWKRSFIPFALRFRISVFA